MLKFLPGEVFKEIRIDEIGKKRYSISNFGRVVSYTDRIEDGLFLKGSMLQGYKTFAMGYISNGKAYRRTKLIFRMVAEKFVVRDSLNHKFVIHLDHNKLNDHYTNLKWATQEELSAHSKNSPRVIEARRRRANDLDYTTKGHKLTPTKVMYIKKIVTDPNRKTRLKILAKRFGVSEMTLHRIRTGENWGHIQIPPSLLRERNEDED
jgi:hypothetical protein